MPSVLDYVLITFTNNKKGIKKILLLVITYVSHTSWQKVREIRKKPQQKVNKTTLSKNTSIETLIQWIQDK